MRPSSQSRPQWIYDKKLDFDTSTQLDQTLTKPFYSSRPNSRSLSQFHPLREKLNASALIHQELVDNIQKEKEKLSQLLNHNHTISRVPVENNCQRLLAEFKQNQVHQEIELLNREHERLKRLLTQRLVKQD